MIRQFCILTLLAFFSVTCYADLAKPTGAYIDGNLGWAMIKSKALVGSEHDQGLTGNFDLGYKFNEYFGLEGNAAFYPGVKAKGKTVSSANYFAALTAKGIMPFNNGFDLFGKAGAAFMHTHWGINSRYDGKEYLRPVAVLGVGLDYYFTQSFSTSVQGLFTTKSGHKVPKTYAVTLGIGYLF